MSGIEIKPMRYGAPVCQRLIGELMADLAERYGGPGDATPTSAIEFDPPDGGFLIAYADGEPVGCAGWRSWSESPEVAEVKRVYTTPKARGLGVARSLMAALEADAKAHGRVRMILETGTAQPEAIALYHALGYVRIDDFGYHKDQPEVRSFGRDL